MYTIAQKEDLPFGGCSRPVWRIRVPRGLENAQLESRVSHALAAAYKESKTSGGSPSAVRVFAYCEGDRVDQVPTAATGTYSPGGDWPGEEGKEWKEVVEISELYTIPSVFPCKAGDTITTGDTPVALSDFSDNWEVDVAVIPPNTDVMVLDVVRQTMAGSHQMFRVRVGTGAVSGWAHSYDFDLDLGTLEA